VGFPNPLYFQLLTGLDITISRPTKLLNYMTAPDTVIWSALLASAAVPGILNPVVIMEKLKDGSIVPWNWGSKFKDGSLR
jgi:predicted acylesterase/phospholipase RssA